MSKAVAEKQNTEVSTHLATFESMAGVGSENVSQEDMAVPFIKCAQALSPEVNKRESEYIEGLDQGDFFNTATKDFFPGDKGFLMVPVLYKRSYIEWTPRDSGGGFVGEHDASILDHAEDDGKGGYKLKNGNIIVVTATWYCLVIGADGTAEQAVITLSSTQFKKSRTLVSLLKKVRVKKADGSGSFEPPFFYNTVRVTSVPESNDQGSWMGWKFALEGNVTQLENSKDIIEYAVATHTAVSQGAVKANMAASKDSSASSQSSGKTYETSSLPDEEIPF